jgi:hypothetical protein
MNKGIQMATGEIIGILNSNDYYTSKDVISEVVKKITSEESQSLYADLIYVSTRDTKKLSGNGPQVLSI